MLDGGAIKPSNSTWSNAAVLVRKKTEDSGSVLILDA